LLRLRLATASLLAKTAETGINQAFPEKI